MRLELDSAGGPWGGENYSYLAQSRSHTHLAFFTVWHRAKRDELSGRRNGRCLEVAVVEILPIDHEDSLALRWWDVPCPHGIGVL